MVMIALSALISTLAVALGDQEVGATALASSPKAAARSLTTKFRDARKPGGKMQHYWNNMAKWTDTMGRQPRPNLPGGQCKSHADCGFSQFCGHAANTVGYASPPDIIPKDFHGKCMQCKQCVKCETGLDNTCGGCHELSKQKNRGFPSGMPTMCKPTMMFVPCGAACGGGYEWKPIAASETTKCVATGFNSHVGQKNKDRTCNLRCHNIKKCRFFRPDCEKCSHTCICNDPLIAPRIKKEEEPAHPHTIGTGKWTNGPVRMLQQAEDVEAARPTISI